MLFPFVAALFFFNDTATTEIYTLSLHDALPIFWARCLCHSRGSLSNAAGFKSSSGKNNFADLSPPVDAGTGDACAVTAMLVVATATPVVAKKCRLLIISPPRSPYMPRVITHFSAFA